MTTPKRSIIRQLTLLLTCCGSVLPAAIAANVTINGGNAAGLINAIQNAKNGDVITVQTGTFNLKGKAPISLKASNVTITAAPGTILEFGATTGSDAGRGIEVHGNNNFIRGLTVQHAPDNGIHIDGNGNTIERCTLIANFDTGVQISGLQGTSNHPANNKIINCDSHDNYDTKASGGNADGYACKINIGPGNMFVGCRAWSNSDDGWDTFPKDAAGTFPVTIDHCISYHNGYHNGQSSGNGNGFKVGSNQTNGANHRVTNSIAVNNKAKGFDQNHNQGKVTIDHCTGANNGAAEFSFSEFSNSGTFTKNVCAGKWDVNGTQSGNITNVSTSVFASTDPTHSTRDSNGNLKFNDFMKFPNSGGAGANP